MRTPLCLSSSTPTERLQKIFCERKLSYLPPLPLQRNIISETKGAISLHLARSGSVANHSAGFDSSCPLAERAIQ